ncbi:Mechanosensitive ion channel protein 8 [Linum perenne]
MEYLRKSFTQIKHTTRLSSSSATRGGGEASDHNHNEYLPILDEMNKTSSSDENSPTKDFTSVDFDSNGNAVVRREASFGFSREASTASADVDPPTKLIHQFLSQQKPGEISLDMDLQMDELKMFDEKSERNLNNNNSNNYPASPLSRRSSVRVSFEPSVSGACADSASDAAADSLRRRIKDNHQDTGPSPPAQLSRDEVLRCTSNNSFRKQASTLSRMKTKSRLLDPPENELERMSGIIAKSGLMYRSGILSKAGGDEEEDDDLELEDLPEDFKKSKLNIWVFLEWLFFILTIFALGYGLQNPWLKTKRIAHLKLWKWEVLFLVLICGRLLSGWLIRILVYCVERNFLLRKRVLYFVYGLKKGVQNCLWLGLVLLAWLLLFDKRVEQEAKGSVKVLKYLTKVLICCLVANFIWLLKTLLVKVLASSFHVSTYFDRIQEALFNQYVIETLSGPPLIEQLRTREEIERTAAEVVQLQNMAGANVPPDLRETVFSSAAGKVIGSGKLIGKSFKGRSNSTMVDQKKVDDSKNTISIDHLHQLNTKNVSAWNMKRLMNIVRHGSLSTLDEQILHGANNHELEDESRKIKSEYEAKAAARKIFYNVAGQNARYIYLQDIMRFMREEEALKTISFFEGASEHCRVSKSSLKNWVVNAFRERRALALTLNDTKTAVNKLHHMVNVIVGVIIVIISLLLLGLAPSSFFVLLGSQIVVVSFIFGNTCKTLFESLIFLFIVHPYDVGDRCEIDTVQLVVEEMNILTTVFLRGDNQKVVYHNNILATKSIGNFYRSPDMGDAIEFLIHVTTPFDKVGIMRQKIISYIEGKKEHWYPSPTVIMKDVDGLTAIRMAVWFRHRMNHQDMGEKFSRRALLVEEIVKIFKELDIQYRLCPIDINIRQTPNLPPLPHSVNN